MSSFSPINPTKNTNQQISSSKRYQSLQETAKEVSNKKDILCPPLINYGNVTAWYYLNNNPWFTLGPDIHYLFFMFPIDILILILLPYFIWDKLNIAAKLFGALTCTLQGLFFMLTATINPGLPKVEYQQQSYRNSLKGKTIFRRCRECLLWVNCETRTYHCFECNVCVEEYDHHCPWITKCIARGNLKLFYGFIFFTAFTLLYYIAVIIYLGINYKKH